MKAIEILKKYQDEIQTSIPSDIDLNEAISELKELDAYKTNYQGAKRRLETVVVILAALENENKSLVKTLEKYNEEMIKLRKENQELLDTIERSKNATNNNKRR